MSLGEKYEVRSRCCVHLRRGLLGRGTENSISMIILTGYGSSIRSGKKRTRLRPAQSGLRLCTNSSSGRTPTRFGRSSMLHPRRTVGTRASGRKPSNMQRETDLRLKRGASGRSLRATAAPLVVLAKLPSGGRPSNGRCVQIGGGSVRRRRVPTATVGRKIGGLKGKLRYYAIDIRTLDRLTSK